MLHKWKTSPHSDSRASCKADKHGPLVCFAGLQTLPPRHWIFLHMVNMFTVALWHSATHHFICPEWDYFCLPAPVCCLLAYLCVCPWWNYVLSAFTSSQSHLFGQHCLLRDIHCFSCFSLGLRRPRCRILSAGWRQYPIKCWPSPGMLNLLSKDRSLSLLSCKADMKKACARLCLVKKCAGSLVHLLPHCPSVLNRSKSFWQPFRILLRFGLRHATQAIAEAMSRLPVKLRSSCHAISLEDAIKEHRHLVVKDLLAKGLPVLRRDAHIPRCHDGEREARCVARQSLSPTLGLERNCL